MKGLTCHHCIVATSIYNKILHQDTWRNSWNMVEVNWCNSHYFISERTTLRSLYAISRPSVVCLSVCLLSVCDVGAPYSGG